MEEEFLFYLMIHSTHLIYDYQVYGIRHIVRAQSDNDIRKSPIATYELLFLINSKWSFMYTIPQTRESEM